MSISKEDQLRQEVDRLAHFAVHDLKQPETVRALVLLTNRYCEIAKRKAISVIIRDSLSRPTANYIKGLFPNPPQEFSTRQADALFTESHPDVDKILQADIVILIANEKRTETEAQLIEKLTHTCDVPLRFDQIYDDPLHFVQTCDTPLHFDFGSADAKHHHNALEKIIAERIRTPEIAKKELEDKIRKELRELNKRIKKDSEWDQAVAGEFETAKHQLLAIKQEFQEAVILKLKSSVKYRFEQTFPSSPHYSPRIIREQLNPIHPADVAPGFLKRAYRHVFPSDNPASVPLEQLFENVKEVCETEYKKVIEEVINESNKEIISFVESVNQKLPRLVLTEMEFLRPSVEMADPGVAFATGTEPNLAFKAGEKSGESFSGAIYPAGFAFYILASAAGSAKAVGFTIGAGLVLTWPVGFLVAGVAALFTINNFNTAKARYKEAGFTKLQSELNYLAYEAYQEVCYRFNEQLEAIIEAVLTAFEEAKRDIEKTVAIKQRFPDNFDTKYQNSITASLDRIEKLLEPEVPDVQPQTSQSTLETLNKIEAHLRPRGQ